MSTPILIMNVKFFNSARFAGCIEELMYANVHSGEEGVIVFSEPTTERDHCISLCRDFHNPRIRVAVSPDSSIVDHSLIKFVLERISWGVLYIFSYGAYAEAIRMHTNKPVFDVRLFGSPRMSEIMYTERRFQCNRCTRLNCPHMFLHGLVQWATKNGNLLDMDNHIVRFNTFLAEKSNKEESLAEMGFLNIQNRRGFMCYSCGYVVFDKFQPLLLIAQKHKAASPQCSMVNASE